MSDSLEGRVERLERANRRLARGLVLVVALAAAPWLAAATTKPTTMEIESLVLRDSTGARRGGFRVERDGSAALVLADAAGRERFSVVTEADGRSSFGFADERGHPRARFQTVEGSSLNFYDRNGKLRAAIGVTEYGPRWVSEAVDREIRKAAGAGDPFSLAAAASNEEDPFEAQDGPVLRFFDPRGRPRLEARVDMNRPIIFLHTEEGTLQAVRGGP